MPETSGGAVLPAVDSLVGGRTATARSAPPRRGRGAIVLASASALALVAGCAVAPEGPDAASTRPPAVVAELAIRERFGVSHPPQLVAFPLPRSAGRGPFQVTDADGRLGPAQRLRDGRLALVTDLPAWGERRWTVIRGAAWPSSAGVVRIEERDRYYEITNGLTGVRVPRGAGDLSRAPAPIQGIRYRDGTWTATGPSYLVDVADRPLRARSLTARVLERGPVRAVVGLDYRLGDPAAPSTANSPAREYHSTIELQAEQPSVLVEDEADGDVEYALDVTEGLRPDRARYRGHHATSPENGREVDGRQYRPDHERQPMDATVDLLESTADPRRPFRRRVAVWDPWIADGGWYWQLYASDAGGSANLLGVFAGRPSRALGAAASGARVWASPREPGGPPPRAGVRLELRRPTADGRVFPRLRVSWGLFVGRKGEDLGDPRTVQAIARQMNVHAGVNLQKVAALADLPGAAAPAAPPAFYMAAERVARLQARVRRDPTYRRWVDDADPTARPLVALWADPTPERRRAVAGAVAATARVLLEALVLGDGIYDPRASYWLGGLAMVRTVPWMNALLADPEASAGERERVLEVARLFAALLWDDDVVPLSPEHGLHLGTENMPVQQREYRSQFALLLAPEPWMRRRAAEVPEEVSARLHAVVDATGAHMSAVHYIGASMGPMLATLQQLQQQGLDLFARDERLRRFATFYLNLLTPPEVRFGGRRKLISVGDSSTESSELLGQLATGFAASNPALSARLIEAWRASGSPHSGFHGTTLLKIDPELPARDPALSSATFPGWFSVLRSGWGSADESAAWLIHGTTYRDHYHADSGAVVLYLLGAPVSLDWGSTYAPRTAGAAMHSVVLPEPLFGSAWDRGGVPLDAGPRWLVDGPPGFARLRHSSHAIAGFALAGHRWSRRLELIHHDTARPVVVVTDRLRPAEAPLEWVTSMNLAATGPVETPAGPMRPPRVDVARADPPSAGDVFALAPGWTRLGFTGQWGVDWDLYVHVAQPARAQIGGWAHAWHPTREQVEFEQAQGRRFEERQYVLRVLSRAGVELVVIPYRHGVPRPSVGPGDVEGGLELDGPAGRLRLSPAGHVFRGDHQLVLTATGEAALRAGGVAVAGGPAELAIEEGSVSLMIAGPAGPRRVTLPPGCVLPAPARVREDRWSVEFDGREPIELRGRCRPAPARGTSSDTADG